MAPVGKVYREGALEGGGGGVGRKREKGGRGYIVEGNSAIENKNVTNNLNNVTKSQFILRTTISLNLCYPKKIQPRT